MIGRRTDSQIALALFGTERPDAQRHLKAFVAEVQDFANALKCPLNRISAAYRTKPQGLITNNAYDYSQYRARIEEQITNGNVDAIGLVSLRDKARYLMFDWQLECEYGSCPSFEAFCVVGLDVNLFNEYCVENPSAIEALLRKFQSYLNVAYGFSILMPRRYLPVGFCMGLATDMPAEFALEASRWAVSGGLKCNKILRNVFGFNILGTEHLSLRVGIQTLQQWIQNGDDRGHLKPLGSGLYLWTFGVAGRNTKYLTWDYPAVARVRKALSEQGVFSWLTTH